MSDQMNSLKTLSLKNIGLKIPQGGGDFLGKTVALLSGSANSYHFKHGQFGENIALSGDFVIVNALTGEVYEGSTLYMPEDFAKTVQTRLDKAAGASVDFEGVEIQCAKSERGARGYTFIVRPVQTPEIVNRKKDMAASLLKHVKALPAPKKPATDKAKAA